MRKFMKEIQKTMSISDLISDLIDKSAFNNLDESSCWLRIYNTPLLPCNNLSNVTKCIENRILFKNIKLSIDCLGISANGPILPFIEHDIPVGSSINLGNLVYKPLPKGPYVFISIPFKIDGKEGEEFFVKSYLNEVESILSMYSGNNFLHSIVFDGEMALTQKGKAGISGPAIPIPAECDGPFLSEDVWNLIIETFQEINKIKDVDKSNRVRLSLKFFQKGKNTFNYDESFFLYWTAIIALLEESKTMYINKKLQRLYSMSQEDVENKLRWKWAYEIRNDILHNAKSVDFNLTIERYFQLLFLDLLRGELDLKCQKFLLKFITEFLDFTN